MTDWQSPGTTGSFANLERDDCDIATSSADIANGIRFYLFTFHSQAVGLMGNPAKQQFSSKGSGSTGPRVLVVTNVPFWNLERGSSRRIDSLVRYLAGHYSSAVCWIGQMRTTGWVAAQDRIPAPLYGPGQPAAWQKGLSRVFSGLVGLAGKQMPAPEYRSTATDSPVNLDHFRSPVIGEFVAGLVGQLKIDVVILQYVTLSYIAEFIRSDHPETSIALDTHDVMHSRKSEFEKYGRVHWLDISRDQEIAALRSCDAVIAIQSQDAREFSKMLPDRPIVITPYACAAHSKVPGDGRQAGDCPVIGFLGSDGDANRTGLSEFLNSCWPIVCTETGGDVRLVIAGPIDPGSVNGVELQNVKFTGPVDNLESFYGSVDVAINPAVIQSGLKIKSLEALSWGVPLVTTTPGIAGMEMAVGKGADVADDWNRFAEHVLKLLNNPELRVRYSSDALSIVEKHFAPEAACSQLVAWINQNI